MHKLKVPKNLFNIIGTFELVALLVMKVKMIMLKMLMLKMIRKTTMAVIGMMMFVMVIG